MRLTLGIVSDIKRVAKHLRGSTLSRTEYVQHVRFSLYQIYYGGATWGDRCRAARVEAEGKKRSLTRYTSVVFEKPAIALGQLKEPLQSATEHARP